MIPSYLPINYNFTSYALSNCKVDQYVTYGYIIVDMYLSICPVFAEFYVSQEAMHCWWVWVVVVVSHWLVWPPPWPAITCSSQKSPKTTARQNGEKTSRCNINQLDVWPQKFNQAQFFSFFPPHTCIFLVTRNLRMKSNKKIMTIKRNNTFKT